MTAHALLSSEEAASLTLPDLAQTATAGIVSRTLVQTPELRVVLFAFAAGQELTAHCSKRRVTVQVLSGECDFLFDGKWQRMRAGDFWHMPPNHMHAVKAALDFTMLLTMGAEPQG